jgi:hypothetical protein
VTALKAAGDDSVASLRKALVKPELAFSTDIDCLMRDPVSASIHRM